MTKKALIGLLLQTTLALGLMLFGWGFDDLGAFFRHPARAALLGVALLSAVLILVFRIDLQPLRKGSRPVGGQQGLAVLLVMGLFFICFLPYGDRRGVLTFANGDALRYLGVVLYAFGNLLALLAVRTLGKQYSGYVTLQDNHQLVQTGIYGVIRHPIYLRMLLVSFAVPLVFRSWLWIPFFVFVVALVTYRIRKEEKLLAEQFGAEFEAYRRRTWRLIPYVY